MTVELSQKYVFDLIKSEEQFPIDFDVAWHWLGYARKDNAKRLLAKCDRGVDYEAYEAPSTTKGGGIKILIMITIDCFKHLAMQAGTPRGKEVRNYFLECERLLKAQKQPERPIKPEVKAFNAALNALEGGDKAEIIKAADKFLENHPEGGLEILKLILK